MVVGEGGEALCLFGQEKQLGAQCREGDMRMGEEMDWEWVRKEWEDVWATERGQCSRSIDFALPAAPVCPQMPHLELSSATMQAGS